MGLDSNQSIKVEWRKVRARRNWGRRVTGRFLLSDSPGGVCGVEKRGERRESFLLGTHVASSGDSGVIKARAGARGTQATAECVGMGGEKALLAKLSESRVRWCGHPRPERTETERMERVSRVTHVRHPPPRSPPPLTILPCFARSSTEEKRETSSTDVHGSPIRLPPFLSLSSSSPFLLPPRATRTTCEKLKRNST